MRNSWMIILLALSLRAPARINAQNSDRTKMECEVLEISDTYRGHQKDLAASRYMLVRHKNPVDRQRFSRWLKTESGTEVMFTAADGTRHHGVLRRMRMCFGPGLLLFTEPATLKERETLVVELGHR